MQGQLSLSRVSLFVPQSSTVLFSVPPQCSSILSAAPPRTRRSSLLMLRAPAAASWHRKERNQETFLQLGQVKDPLGDATKKETILRASRSSKGKLKLEKNPKIHLIILRHFSDLWYHGTPADLLLFPNVYVLNQNAHHPDIAAEMVLGVVEVFRSGMQVALPYILHRLIDAPTHIYFIYPPYFPTHHAYKPQAQSHCS